MTCIKCGANLQIKPNQKAAFCSYCGAELLLDDGAQHVVYDNAEDAGYRFEKGRQKAQREYSNSYPRSSSNISTKKKTAAKSPLWLWVVGWLLFFPIPLTIIISRTSASQKIKTVVLAVAWVLYLVIVMRGCSNNLNNSALNTSANNIKSLSMSNTNEITLNIGDIHSGPNVYATVRRQNDFSIDDVIFVSENPDVATITFSYDTLTTYLYFDVCAVGSGDTYVYASSVDGSVVSERIHVIVPEPILAESIDLGGDITLSLGESTVLFAGFSPANTEDQTLTWSSDNTDVILVGDSGNLTAVAGGVAVVTATTVNGVSDSCVVTVDGSRRNLNLTISHTREDDNDIGSDWYYHDTINDEVVINGTYPVAVGDVLIFSSCYTEDDDNPDVGRNSVTHAVTENDFNDGFVVTYDVYVTENGGRYSGRSAHFVVEYTFIID